MGLFPAIALADVATGVGIASGVANVGKTVSGGKGGGDVVQAAPPQPDNSGPMFLAGLQANAQQSDQAIKANLISTELLAQATATNKPVTPPTVVPEPKDDSTLALAVVGAAAMLALAKD